MNATDSEQLVAALRELLAVERVPRVTLRVEEAAAALGVSRDTFDEKVKPELRIIRRGRLVLVPMRELERWATEQAAKPLG